MFSKVKAEARYLRACAFLDDDFIEYLDNYLSIAYDEHMSKEVAESIAHGYLDKLYKEYEDA